VHFTGARNVHAVNGVSFSVREREVLTLLGESGCGKSVTLRSLMRLLPPQRVSLQGRIRIAGHDILALGERELAAIRGRDISMVFQEPGLAMDRVHTIGEQIVEVIRRHQPMDRRTARARALEMLDRVRIPSAATRLDAYPHELSGGMRQRAMIALALACRPRLLLADEPTTALDATVQIQILMLLRELQDEFGMSVIFVTHDIGVAAQVSDRIAVMYAGRIVEEGSAAQVVRSPQHPYTRGLLGSLVHATPRGQALATIPGAPPALDVVPTGCSFAPRCRERRPGCEDEPPLQMHAHGRRVRCILPARPAPAAP
jgi:peptide/nickel transport system ATP-binding protein